MKTSASYHGPDRRVEQRRRSRALRLSPDQAERRHNAGRRQDDERVPFWHFLSQICRRV